MRNRIERLIPVLAGFCAVVAAALVAGKPATAQPLCEYNVCGVDKKCFATDIAYECFSPGETCNHQKCKQS